MERVEHKSQCTTSNEANTTVSQLNTKLIPHTTPLTQKIQKALSPLDFPPSSLLPAKTSLQPLMHALTTPMDKKKGRLQRSERLLTIDNIVTNCSSGEVKSSTTTIPTAYSPWEAFVKESFGQIAWPIKITSWESADDRVKIVPNSSSATELISRRGVFSQQHYGSADQLQQSDLDGLDPNFKRFRIENGDSLAEKEEAEDLKNAELQAAVLKRVSPIDKHQLRSSDLT